MSTSHSPIQRSAPPVADTQEASKKGPSMSPPTFQLKSGPVQRKDLLDATKLKSAKAFYTKKATDFTPAIIKEIQGQVGQAKTGVMDDATLQAIAKFQKGKGLTVDGQLGTKSLPLFFPHGLATDAAQKGFAKDYLGIDWSKLKTPQAKGQKIVDHINTRLKAAGVPEVGIHIQDLGGDSGRFSFSNWFIRLGKKFLEKKSYTQAELDDFANTIIHEARHAEQWFNMAQRLAGEGKTAAEIEKETAIQAKVVKAAVASQIKKGSAKALVTKGWYESVYGSGRAHRSMVLGPKGTYNQYKNLPEESDAWRVGDDFNDHLADERKAKAKAKKNP